MDRKTKVLDNRIMAFRGAWIGFLCGGAFFLVLSEINYEKFAKQVSAGTLDRPISSFEVPGREMNRVALLIAGTVENRDLTIWSWQVRMVLLLLIAANSLAIGFFGAVLWVISRNALSAGSARKNE